ncbi:hypothetical protein D1007_00364 [Hordeum vulgare]|nr:hypothetical protein D1007_00364 [Hordeum vulgare]
MEVYRGKSSVLYKVFTNELYALTAFEASEMNKNIYDGLDALSSIPWTRDSENKLRGTVKLVGLLGCASSADARAPTGPMCTLASSSHVASSSRLVQEDEEEDDEEEDEEE